MENWITFESFGSECPDNWEEIANYLNDIIRERGIEDDHDAVNELWDEYWSGKLSRSVSIDNGATFCTPAEALQHVSIDTLAQYMDDGIRELVAREIAPCTDEAFLARYLELAPCDLIIG